MARVGSIEKNDSKCFDFYFIFLQKKPSSFLHLEGFIDFCSLSFCFSFMFGIDTLFRVENVGEKNPKEEGGEGVGKLFCLSIFLLFFGKKGYK